MSVLSKNNEKDLTMINTYEEATAKIANSEYLRKMREEKNYVKTTMGAGANCTESCYMPFILSR